jgi:cytochrome c-type biogenesis protein CcmH
MRRLAILSLALLATLVAVGAEREGAFDDPALNERYWSLIREIRCPLCLNESIADSDAPVAADLRREVHRLLEGGATDQQVIDFLRERYGDFVLYRPRLTPATWALWAGPFVFIAIGSVVFWRILLKRRNQPLGEDFEA